MSGSWRLRATGYWYLYRYVVEERIRGFGRPTWFPWVEETVIARTAPEARRLARKQLIGPELDAIRKGTMRLRVTRGIRMRKEDQ